MARNPNLPSQSYLEQFKTQLEAAFPTDFPLYMGEENAPNHDAPPRVVWYPVIGEIKESEFGAYREAPTDDPDGEGVYREVVADRHLSFAFECWAEDLIAADLLVSAVYARVRSIKSNITRGQEQWQRDDQQTTLGSMVTLLITVPMPLADNENETTEVLASVIARVKARTEEIQVNNP